MTKKVLGRGLEALIPSSQVPSGAGPAVATAEEPSVRDLPLAAIRPNPRQPRHHIDEKALGELETSIRAQGILQPLLVRPAAEGYELIAGERRFMAAQRAGLERVPVVVREFADQQVLEASLVENLQREDLDPMDEAMGYQALMDDLGYTHERVAERVGKDRTTITNSLRLLGLPQEVQDMVSRGTLTAGHARALLSLGSQDDIRAAARYVNSMGFSVRKTEAFVSRKLKRRIQARRRASAPGAHVGTAPGSALAEIEDRLRRLFATQVRVVAQANGGGKVEIEYYSQAELERLLEVWGAL
jgi:ParB family chromosome partitioning protein